MTQLLDPAERAHDPARVIVVGGGGVGTMAAYNLEAGGLAETVIVLRSNYEIVASRGFSIDSCQHGRVDNWRPRGGIVSASASPKENARFDYVLCCTKNIPDAPGPNVTQLVGPYVTSGHTVIVLIQNGINIERPLLDAYPENVVLSGISLIGVFEHEPSKILHNDADKLIIGAFANPVLPSKTQETATDEFIKLYSASGKVTATLDTDVRWTRWRKLLYNAVYNPISALTNTDTGRLRLSAREDKNDPNISHNVLDHLILPAMKEIQAAAKAVDNVDLPDDLLWSVVEADDVKEFLLPSMQQDRQRGRYVECEVILGETLRLGEAARVSMPIIRTMYCMCRALQFQVKDSQGLVDIKELATRYAEEK